MTVDSTVLPHAGLTMNDNLIWPGLILVVVGMLGVISGVATAAYGRYEWLPTTVLIAALGWVFGVIWLVVERRRVARVDAQRYAAYPGGCTRPGAGRG